MPGTQPGTIQGNQGEHQVVQGIHLHAEAGDNMAKQKQFPRPEQHRSLQYPGDWDNHKNEYGPCGYA